jgi:spoIIIJ-associated protein
VEWVETTGKSVEQAKEAALDQLGIHEDEAEFEVMEEPRPGLFGRMRGDARVRARVAPKAPRAKQERRERRRKGGSEGSAKKDAKPSSDAKDDGGTVTTDAPATDGPAADGDSRAGRSNGGRQRKSRSPKRSQEPSTSTGGESSGAAKQGEQDMSGEVVTVGEQADIVEGFLDGLLEAFGAEGEVKRQQLDDETIEVGVDGEDLGLLIGPKGQTLAAVQDLSRTVVQRRAPGPHEGRVRIDVSGYRQRRQEALVRFTQQVADQVKESGAQKALEPMGPADRKVVHDAANDIDGVSTLSEGEEPRRRVVIVPADS